MSDFKMPDMNSLMDMAKRLQGDMSKAQEELAKKTCEASSGGGMVSATVNGANQIVSLSIDKTVANPDDLEMLQDLVVAAVNQALDKMKEVTQQEMGKYTAGMNMPGIPGFSK